MKTIARTLGLLAAPLLVASCSSTPVGDAPVRDDAWPSDAWPAFAWIGAIEAQDWDAMRALLADDAVYEDPTAADERGVPLRHVGPDAIVEFWRSSSDDSEAQNIRYRVDERFTSGGVTVLTMWLTIDVGGKYWNVDRDVLHLSGRQVTAITERDGLIVRVIDLVDYEAAFDRIDALREEYGERDAPLP